LDEYKKLEQMIFSIEEREQKTIGQNLHDSLGQTLTGIAFKTKSMEKGCLQLQVKDRGWDCKS